MVREKNKAGLVIVVLLLIILVLVAIVAYSFLIRPSINAYIVQKQIEAKDIILNTMIVQVQQQGYTQITDQEGNVLNLFSEETCRGLLQASQTQ